MIAPPTDSSIGSPIAASQTVAIAGAATTFSLAGFRFNKRSVLSAIIGASIGFGIGIATQAIVRFILDKYDRSRRRDGTTVDEMMHELSLVKSELSELHHLLLTSHRSGRSLQLREQSPRYSSEDENDEFYDPEDGSLPIGQHILSGATSFQSFTSTSRSDGFRLGPPLPAEIMEELDQIAESAMGLSSPLTTSTPKLIVTHVDSRPRSQAYARCMLYRHAYRRTPEFLWRFARATYLAAEEASTEDDQSTTLLDDGDYNSDVASISSRTYDPRSLNDIMYEANSRRQFVECGLAVARRALFYGNCAQRQEHYDIDFLTMAEIYKWLAVMVGLASDFGGMEQRITYGFEFKQLIDKAIEYNPLDAHSHYMRGRWAYQVYNLTWIERQLASRLIAAPPTASLDEAIEDLEEAERLQPNKYAAIHLFIAKCFLSNSDYTNAGTWLNTANQLIVQNRMPLTTPHLDTSEVQKEIESLLYKYSSYF